MITWQQFKSQIPSKLHGPDLSKVSNVAEKAQEAADTMLNRIDPLMTKRKARIENAIYDEVYNYVAPSDLKGDNKITDIRPVAVRSSEDETGLTSPRSFDISKEKGKVTVEVINGVKTLRLSKELDPRTILHRCDSLTLEGTVSASGDVESLKTNDLEYISGTESIQFDLSGSTGSGTLEFALDNEIDLSDEEDLGALFHWLKFPDASDLTSVELRWGSDSSNYWSKTVTSPHDRDSFEDNAWVLNSYAWQSASETGSPDSEKVDYLAIVISYSNSQQNVFVDNITAALGEAYEIVYYSDHIFKDTSGSWNRKPDEGSDTIMLDGAATNIFMNEFMKICAQTIQGKNMANDIAYFNSQLGLNSRGQVLEGGMYDEYGINYPSEALAEQEQYYPFDRLGP